MCEHEQVSDRKPINFLGGLPEFLWLSLGFVMLGLLVLTVVTPLVTLCYQTLLWLRHGRWIKLPLLESTNWILDKLGANVVIAVPFQDSDWVGASRLASSVCEADTWYSLPVIFLVINLVLLGIAERFKDESMKKARPQRSDIQCP